MSKRWCLLALAAVVASAPRPTIAAYHVAVIDEIMTSYSGDPTVQFVEIRMAAAGQNLVAHSVLAAFDTSGAYVGDVLVVPTNVANGTSNGRWLMGTSQFATVSGLTPDFIIPATLPTPGGMLCWGGGNALPVPANPPTWNRSVFSNYIDCIAYGGYTGSTNSHIGTPTSLDAVGHSLQRISTSSDNAVDFACADPATPTTNVPMSMNLPATTSCPPPPTATFPPPGPIVNSIPTISSFELVLYVGLILVAGGIVLWRRRESFGQG